MDVSPYKVRSADWRLPAGGAAYLRWVWQSAKNTAGGLGEIVSATGADIVYTIVFALVFGIQIVLIAFVPGIGPAVAFAYSCLQTGLYAFEYTWINIGWTLPQRILYFEERWLYFLGFGLPCTAATYFLSFFVRCGRVFFVLFPPTTVASIS